MAISKITGAAVGKDVIMKEVATADGSSPTLTLQTGDTDIAADDVLGTINFQAPDEGAGTDAILVAAGISAVSEGDFSSSSNATKLVFKTGASEAATEKMSLSSAGNLTITTADNSDQLTLKSTDADASSGPSLSLTRDSGSPADNDAGGKINFNFDDDGGNVSRTAAIFTTLVDASAGSEDGKIHIETMIGGAEGERFGIGPTEVVVNEASVDLDFRVEGNGETHALSLQASDDRVAVGGTGTYTGKFTINSAINNNSGCAINANASDFAASVMDLNTLRNTTDGTYFFLSASITGVQTKVRVQDSGNFLNVNNSYGSLSDEKLKENIADASSQWDDIKAIKVRKYSMKEDELSSANRIGVIAQELETAGLNNLVEEIQDEKRDTNKFLEDGETPNPYYWQIIGKEETKTKSVKYSILYMKAVKALQEAMTRIETLETKVKALEES